MNWTEPRPPAREFSYYDHVICETPLGRALIEWKGWKESDTYSITIGGEYIGDGRDLDDAKNLAKEWLTNKRNELSGLLGLKSSSGINQISMQDLTLYYLSHKKFDFTSKAIDVLNDMAKQTVPSESGYEPCNGCDTSCVHWECFFCDKK